MTLKFLVLSISTDYCVTACINIDCQFTYLNASLLLSDLSLLGHGTICSAFAISRLRYSFRVHAVLFAFKSFSSSRVSVSRSADVLYMDGYLWNVFVSPDVAQLPSPTIHSPYTP